MFDNTTSGYRHEVALRRVSQLIGWAFVLLVVAAVGGAIYWQLVERDRRAARELQHQTIKTESGMRRAFHEAVSKGAAREALQMLAILHKRSSAATGRAPQSWADVKPLDDIPVEDATQSVSKPDCQAFLEVAWGFNIGGVADEDLSMTMVAWEKTPDREGRRWVLFADLRTIKQVDEREFARLRTPKSK